MELTENIKNEIIRESKEFKEKLADIGTDEYGSMSKETRDEFGAFYTPAELVIKMLEMYDCTLEEFSQKTILDPTSGSGNLIMGALIAGSSVNKNYPDMVFGNEFAEPPLKICRNRFRIYCEKHGLTNSKNENWSTFWNWHIHRGDALNKDCLTEFDPNYSWNPTTGKVKVEGRKFSLNRK